MSLPWAVTAQMMHTSNTIMRAPQIGYHGSQAKLATALTHRDDDGNGASPQPPPVVQWRGRDTAADVSAPAHWKIIRVRSDASGSMPHPCRMTRILAPNRNV